MPAIVIVGAQWGDEGKGKIVDLLAEHAGLVVRYGGGPNAGHTLVIGDERLVLRLVPSGVLHPHTTPLLGHGMVINLGSLLEELDALDKRGIDATRRLIIAEQAHVILPHHILLDGLRESAATGTKLGTTRRGVGPCYEDKTGRRGVRVGDLRHPEQLRMRVREALANATAMIESLGGTVPDAAAVLEELLVLAPRIVPMLGDVPARIEAALRKGERVMLEGAQGTMLDIDHGTYPYVTSSSATAGGACTGAGVGPTRIDRVLGITKAYTTRVGEGPFPTELHDADGERLRTIGHEYGSVTGRPRRTGWLDLPALRHARRVNGLDALTMTKLDVLRGFDTIPVCVAYETPDGRSDDAPPTSLAGVTPIYERRPGWSEDISGCRTLASLPRNVRAYLEFVEERTELSVDLVSVGPRREETIVVRDSWIRGERAG
ncbi:MAG: adenylosuccinate synthase [Myxococcales bacterium]|nr:adenylosuccinate synthase [Myxococcales bacterium]